MHKLIIPDPEEGADNSHLADLFDARNRRESKAETKERIATTLGDELKNNRQFKDFAEAFTDGYTDEAASTMIKAWARVFNVGEERALLIALHLCALDEFSLSGTSPVDDKALARREFGRFALGIRAFLRQMYKDTQTWLKRNHISSITAFRGMTYADGDAPKGLGEGETATVRTYPLVSWSLDEDVAASMFAYRRDRGFGTLYVATIPADRIIATPQTGFGSKSEQELVMLGGKDEVLVF